MSWIPYYFVGWTDHQRIGMRRSEMLRSSFYLTEKGYYTTVRNVSYESTNLGNRWHYSIEKPYTQEGVYGFLFHVSSLYIGIRCHALKVSVICHMQIPIWKLIKGTDTFMHIHSSLLLTTMVDLSCRRNCLPFFKGLQLLIFHFIDLICVQKSTIWKPFDF